MSNFGKALMITAIPISVVSIISATGTAARGTYDTPFFFLWAVAAIMWMIAILVASIYTVKGKREIAVGIWVGIGIGIVSLGLTCFANMQV